MKCTVCLIPSFIDFSNVLQLSKKIITSSDVHPIQVQSRKAFYMPLAIVYQVFCMHLPIDDQVDSRNFENILLVPSVLIEMLLNHVGNHVLHVYFSHAHLDYIFVQIYIHNVDNYTYFMLSYLVTKLLSY